MERGLILLVAALMAYVAPGVQGTAQLSFANNTQVNITRAGCRVSKLCVETPADCDPTGNNSCLFASVVASTPVAPNGTELSIELSGASKGYIALGLTAKASAGTTMLFICAQNSSNNGTFLFRTKQRNNTDGVLTPTETSVTEIRGTVKGNVIQCEFNVPNVNASRTRTSPDTTFSILIGTGTFDGTDFGPFNISRDSGPLNLADPTSNATTTAPTGSSGAVHPQAVLLLLSVLTLSVMLRA
ncbi:ferric-chelate reductase 1-like [Siniperca chuatsi]|uniref:ferric-chelate reductase 1-like n=1 Tax=Siniperca chuatsi TaxID=119488 RepID=UPI001CE13DF0|nr:ferric-chelate reductase 1-like [Siniperca chuatsi]